MATDTTTTLAGMPRQSSRVRVQKLIDGAIDKALAAIREDLDDGDYDGAWEGAQALHALLEGHRTTADAIRGEVLTTTAREDERSMVYVAKRFGISRSRATQLIQVTDERG